MGTVSYRPGIAAETGWGQVRSKIVHSSNLSQESKVPPSLSVMPKGMGLI
jgi:hypothetical protein